MTTRLMAFLLIIFGIIFISYSGFNYVTTENIVDIGPIQVEAEKNNFVKLSPIVGIIMLLGGVFLMFWRKK